MKRSLPLILLFLLISCDGNLSRIGRPQLGTVVNVTFIGDTAVAPQTAQAVFDEIERVESLMSPRRPGSDIDRLNREGAAGPVIVSAETYDLIKKSADISVETGGCFDVTFAAIAHLWDYTDKRFSPPARAAVASLLPLVNSKNILFYPGKKGVAFARHGMKIGLGAIAKGYAVQRGIIALKKKGVRNAIVEAGGDLQVAGSKFGKPWITGLRHPRKDTILATINLEDMDAVATSGDYERFVMRNGVRYHHIIDPRTGYPTDTFYLGDGALEERRALRRIRDRALRHGPGYGARVPGAPRRDRRDPRGQKRQALHVKTPEGEGGPPGAGDGGVAVGHSGGANPPRSR